MRHRQIIDHFPPRRSPGERGKSTSVTGLAIALDYATRRVWRWHWWDSIPAEEWGRVLVALDKAAPGHGITINDFYEGTK